MNTRSSAVIARGGDDPELSSAFRQALEARLKPEAALRAAIAREEKNGRRSCETYFARLHPMIIKCYNGPIYSSH